jgi:Uma2 family endonuclease
VQVAKISGTFGRKGMSSITQDPIAGAPPVLPAPASAARPPVDYQPRLLTVADLDALPSDLPSGPVCYELDNGRLLIMPPPGDIHGAVELNLGAHLKIQGEFRGHGKARSGDVGIILWRNPDRVVGADAAFIANRSLPIRRSPEGYLETIPELVVEVRSKNDTVPAIQRKVDDYLAAGVRVVWLADPAARTVTAHRRGVEPQVFREDDTLTVEEDIIPGFQLLVRDALQE